MSVFNHCYAWTEEPDIGRGCGYGTHTRTCWKRCGPGDGDSRHQKPWCVYDHAKWCSVSTDCADIPVEHQFTKEGCWEACGLM